MRKISFLAALFILVLTVSAAPALAVSGSDVVSFTVGCDAFIVTYTEVLFDRDNTGTGYEAYHAFVTDGAGNVLGAIAESREVGDTIPGQTEDFPYGAAPVSNPIRFVLISDAGNGFDEQVVWDLSGDCPDLPPSHKDGAPGIPDGFVFATIICDTPVYNTQSGQPVGDAAITAGQTWYVNPEPVDGDDGQQWTEIYVSSTTNPFIPTVCVQ